MRQGKPLVLQHLEGVSHEVFRKHPEILRRHIGGRAGIYALYRENRLLYVGLAKYLTVRLMQHLTDDLGGKWDQFSVYLTARDEHIRELESLVLRIVMPSGNKATGSLAQSTNLGPDVDRDIKRLSEPADPGPQPKKGPRGPKGARRALQGRLGNQKFRATLQPDGTITHAQRSHRTPSGAASAALGRACNGWTFWQYRDGSGEWVPLENLRT